jgi:signal transduction histidine kinase
MWRVRINELFEGITPTIIALAALVCLVDAVQDRLNVLFVIPFPRWILRAVPKTYFTTSLIALLLIFSVFGTLNRFPRPAARQNVAVAVAVIVAAALGVWLMMYWWGWLNIRPGVKEGWWYNSTPTQFVKHFVRYLTIGALFAASITMYRRERLRNEALLQTEIAQAQLGQQLDEARLQALLAQIEPHFLFNTLANVRGLYQSDAAAAKRMLENLRRYLTVALPRMRESDSTIGREAALAEAYLAIQQIRMGKRLAFSIHVPANLQHAPLPPMMLLTLVENAIKHGLGQLPEGGTIAIMVSQDDGLLSVRVADSGRGFAKQLGNGAGLANIRARLAALHGEAGRLRLARNTPRGVTATIVVPWTGPEAC